MEGEGKGGMFTCFMDDEKEMRHVETLLSDEPASSLPGKGRLWPVSGADGRVGRGEWPCRAASGVQDTLMDTVGYSRVWIGKGGSFGGGKGPWGGGSAKRMPMGA